MRTEDEPPLGPKERPFGFTWYVQVGVLGGVGGVGAGAGAGGVGGGAGAGGDGAGAGGGDGDGGAGGVGAAGPTGVGAAGGVGGAGPGGVGVGVGDGLGGAGPGEFTTGGGGGGGAASWIRSNALSFTARRAVRAAYCTLDAMETWIVASPFPVVGLSVVQEASLRAAHSHSRAVEIVIAAVPPAWEIVRGLAVADTTQRADDGAITSVWLLAPHA